MRLVQGVRVVAQHCPAVGRNAYRAIHINDVKRSTDLTKSLGEGVRASCWGRSACFPPAHRACALRRRSDGGFDHVVIAADGRLAAVKSTASAGNVAEVDREPQRGAAV